MRFEKQPRGEQKESKKQKERLQEKIESLRELGVRNDEAIEYLARHFKLETLKEKIETMRNLGFEDPVKLIERHPQLASRKIEGVIKSLKEAGFENPVRLIERFPPLAGFNIERVKRLIKFLDRLIRLYKLEGISGKEIGENFPQLFGYNKYRIYFYLRVLRGMKKDDTITPKELFKKGRALIVNNPYLIFSFLRESKPQNFEELEKILTSIQKLSKEEKYKRITEIKNELSNIIESLQKSLKENAKPDPYDEFLLKLAQRLEKLEKEKKEKEIVIK